MREKNKQPDLPTHLQVRRDRPGAKPKGHPFAVMTPRGVVRDGACGRKVSRTEVEFG